MFPAESAEARSLGRVQPDLTGRGMQRLIIGFHQDGEGHWVADLECGHSQHVRHDPPWQVRPWVQSVEGRAAMIGTAVECVLCKE